MEKKALEYNIGRKCSLYRFWWIIDPVINEEVKSQVMFLYWVDDKKLCNEKTQNIEIDCWAWWLGLIAKLQNKEDK